MGDYFAQLSPTSSLLLSDFLAPGENRRPFLCPGSPGEDSQPLLIAPQEKIPVADLSRLSFSLAMLQPEYDDHELVTKLVGQFLQKHRSNTCYLIHLVDVAWSVCRYKHLFANHPEYQPLVLDLFKRLYSLPVTRNRILLAKVFEINNSLENENWGKGSGIDGKLVEKQWRASCEEADQLTQTKTENSRLHAELLLKIEQTMKMRK